MTSALPPLRGSPAQIKWASTIRDNALSVLAGGPEYDLLYSIDDATWWLANRAPGNESLLGGAYAPPAPHQVVGGPPLPPRAARKPVAMPPQPDELHDAIKFAVSVSRNPKLAELAVIAALSRLYRGNEAACFKNYVEHCLNGLRDQVITELDRDLDGIRRILGKAS